MGSLLYLGRAGAGELGRWVLWVPGGGRLGADHPNTLVATHTVNSVGYSIVPGWSGHIA